MYKSLPTKFFSSLIIIEALFGLTALKIPKEFQANYNNHEEKIINQLEREIRACENIIKIQKENEIKLINGLRKMKHQQDEQDDLKQFMEESKFVELERNIKETIIVEDIQRRVETQKIKFNHIWEKRI